MEVKKPAKTLRVCETGWIHDPYIMDQIMEYVATANVNAGWNFDYDTPQLIQFTKYECRWSLYLASRYKYRYK